MWALGDLEGKHTPTGLLGLLFSHNAPSFERLWEPKKVYGLL